MADHYRTRLPLRSPADPDPAIAAPLAATAAAIGMVPNLYAAMANFPALLESYGFGYQRFREQSGFSPIEQEVVLLTISRVHECSYCVAAHSLAADMARVPPGVTEAVRNDLPIADERLQALRELTREMVVTRGFPTAGKVEAFVAAGYAERQILAILLAISIKVISNYTNHLFDTELDPAFTGRAWAGGATPPA